MLTNRPTLDKIIEQLKSISKKMLQNSHISKEISASPSTLMSNIRKYENNTDEIMTNIEKEVINVYPNFKSNLIDLYPNLTISLWKYSCLLLFDISPKDEAIIFKITYESVLIKRSRFRKKLNINKDSTIYNFLVDIALGIY